MSTGAINWRRLVLATFVVGLFAGGCGPAAGERPAEPKPSLTQGLEKDSYAVGEEFIVEGQNFLAAEGRTKLEFKGEFRARDGSETPTRVKVALAVEENDDGKTQIGRWLRFGPFNNPFVDEPKVGKFVGTVTPINEYIVDEESGKTTEVRGESRNVKFEVEPSIEFVEFQPKGADCGEPALRALEGAEYRIKVRAVGFTPETFEWRISSLKGKEELRDYEIFRTPATGPTDSVGDEEGESIEFQPVPNGTKYYQAGVQVRAKDQATGKYVHSSLPVGVHRPVEVESIGEFELAQHYEPEPVTGCIPGTVGNKATYSEQETETRQRTVSIGISENFTRSKMRSQSVNWMEGYGVTESQSRTEAQSRTESTTETTSQTEGQSYNQSESNSFNYGTTEGETWTTGNEAGVKAGAEGGASIPLVAEGKVSTEAHYNRSWGHSESEQTSKNWGETVSRGESHSFSKSFTLSNSVSSSRSISDTKSRSESRTYNFGASATESERIDQGITESEEQTWMESDSSTTLTSYSGFIPVGKSGVFYRQTTRMVRRAKVRAFNACGEVEQMGEMHLNTWNWAPDLATIDDKKCGEELPEPGLPPAKCHIEPCE